MFAYCGNNPVNCIDPTGHWPKIFSDIGNAICSGAKAVANAVKKVGKAIKGSFQVEGGVGYGMGISASIGSVKGNVSAYQDDFTIGWKNNQSYTAIKGSAGLYVQINEKDRLGLSTDYEHRFETDYNRDWDAHTTLSSPASVYACEKTVKNPIQFNVPIINPVEGNLSEDSTIGISVEAHFILGGHFSIAWDPSEFMRIISE